MPLRATKRGTDRTRIEHDCDVLICGASFAGLAVARTLAGSGAKVLVLDRYEIGERQTSACGIPTDWLTSMGLDESSLQSFDSLLVHTPWASVRWQLPWTFSTFDYKALCSLLWEQTGLPDSCFETAKVDGVSRAAAPGGEGRAIAAEGAAAGGGMRMETESAESGLSGLPAHTVHTDRGEVRAPIVIDALGWRRVLANAISIQPPNARLSRGLEVHPGGFGEEMELWIDPRYVRAGYGWSFPAREEIRVGVGSFWPSHHVRDPTVRLAGDLGLPPDGYQGNWIPHQLRPAVEDGVFFVGDSAGHCLPLTAEGIRTAFYFGLACGRQLRAVIEGRATREQALQRYAAFSDAHEWKYRWLLHSQRAIGRLTTTPLVTLLSRGMGRPRLARWAFDHYLNVAPPSFAEAPPRLPTRSRSALAATA